MQRFVSLLWGAFLAICALPIVFGPILAAVACWLAFRPTEPIHVAVFVLGLVALFGSLQVRLILGYIKNLPTLFR